MRHLLLHFARVVIFAAGFATAMPSIAIDGLPDPGFGANGRSYFYWGRSNPAYDYSMASAVQPDGRVVLVGTIGENVFNGGNTSIGIGRLLPNGQFDTSFGEGGQAVIQSSAQTYLKAYAVAVQPDGKILVAGRSFNVLLNAAHATVWRLMPNGSLDTSYGIGGRATLPRAVDLAPDDSAYAIALSPTGWALVGGSVREGSGLRDVAMFWLDPQGNHDSAYANYCDTVCYHRKRFTYNGAPIESEAYAVRYAPDIGTAFYTGIVRTPTNSPISLFGYTDANLVTTGGFQPFTFDSTTGASRESSPSAAFAMERDAARHRIWVVGTVKPGDAAYAGADLMGIAAFHYDATYDTGTLGGDGRAMLDFGVGTRIGHARANTVLVQQDGRVLLGGSFFWDTFGNDARMTVLRLAVGPDTTFGNFSASLPGVQALQVPINGQSAETVATDMHFVPGTEQVIVTGYTHDFAVPGSYYYAAAKLTNALPDRIFANGFQ